MATPEPPADDAAVAAFTQDQHRLLRAALNRIIPREGDMPAAGDADVGGFIERFIQGSAGLRRLFLDGLRAIAIEGARAGGAFADAPPEAQDDALRRVEATAPLFFAWIVDLAYRGYYVRPDVHAALGYDGRPPQPRGFAVAPFDERLLSQQKNRVPLWRPTPTLRPDSPVA